MWAHEQPARAGRKHAPPTITRAVDLTSAAEDVVRADSPEANAMALLGAHAACEALLGLLATRRATELAPKPRSTGWVMPPQSSPQRVLRRGRLFLAQRCSP